jgi:hypothetical protein
MTMAEEIFIEDSTAGGYEWDGDLESSDRAQIQIPGGDDQSTVELYNDVTNGMMNGGEAHRTHNAARALSGHSKSSEKNDGTENAFPFTSLYRVKTPIRFMKPRSGRPRSALSNNSQTSALGRVDSKDSISSTPTTVVSDDPRRLLDVKLSRR